MLFKVCESKELFESMRDSSEFIRDSYKLCESANTLSLNTIHIQDIFDFLDSLPNKCADLAIIDPPYNLKVASWDRFKSQSAFLDFSFAWIDKMLPKLKDTGSFYIFNTPYNCVYDIIQN